VEWSSSRGSPELPSDLVIDMFIPDEAAKQQDLVSVAWVSAISGSDHHGGI